MGILLHGTKGAHPRFRWKQSADERVDATHCHDLHQSTDAWERVLQSLPRSPTADKMTLASASVTRSSVRFPLSHTQTEQLMKIWHTQIDRELNETFRKTAKLHKWRSHPQRTAISLSLHTIVSHTPESTRGPLLVFINTLGRVALSLLACHKLSATFTRRSSRLLFI